MNPLDRLTTIISELMGKEPSDPDVLKVVVELMMAIREPSEIMGRGLPTGYWPGSHSAAELWKAMIDALLTEGEG